MSAKTWLRACTQVASLIAVCSLPMGAGGAAQGQEAQASQAGPFILMFQMHVKADREQDFVKLVAQMAHRVKTQDHGNIRYELFAVAPPGNAAAAAPAAGAVNYVFLEEWRDQAAATAHGKWAGPIVRTQWRDMTDSMQVMRLTREPPR